MGNSNHENLGTAVFTINLLLRGGRGLPDTDVKWADAAADQLVVEFMWLLQSGVAAASADSTISDELIDGYSYATWKRLAGIERKIVPEDLIPLDTWLADPVPEHYYGPNRIH